MKKKKKKKTAIAERSISYTLYTQHILHVHLQKLYGPHRAKTCLPAYADREGPDQPAHLAANQGRSQLTESLDTTDMNGAKARMIFCACAV